MEEKEEGVGLTICFAQGFEKAVSADTHRRHGGEPGIDWEGEAGLETGGGERNGKKLEGLPTTPHWGKGFFAES